MKKLKLKALTLSAKEILEREQLRNVLGADGSGNADCRCYMPACGPRNGYKLDCIKDTCC